MVQFECFPSGPGFALSSDSSVQGPCHVSRALSAACLGCCAASLTQPERNRQKHLLQQVPCPNLFSSALCDLPLPIHPRAGPSTITAPEGEGETPSASPPHSCVSASFLLRFHTSAHRSAARWGLGLLFCCSVDRKRRQTNAVAMYM